MEWIAFWLGLSAALLAVAFALPIAWFLEELMRKKDDTN